MINAKTPLFTSLTLKAGVLSIGAFVVPMLPITEAGACSRPGTPNEVQAVATSPTVVELRWRNTTNKGMNKSGSTGYNDQPHAMYFDISVRNGAGQPVGRDITGGAYQRALVYGSRSTYSFTGLAPKTTYCFRMRARTGPGTQGCVSQIFSAQTCATTPDADIHAVCDAYANNAVRQASTMQTMQQAGACRSDGPRWSAIKATHYDWCKAMREQGMNSHLAEEKARADILKTCKPARAPGPSTSAPQAPPRPAPRQCNMNAILTIHQCKNLDGSPAEQFVPGSQHIPGCGATADEAVEAAKAVYRAPLDEGAPTDEPEQNGGCIYTKEIFVGACACTLPDTRALRLPPRPSRLPGASSIKVQQPPPILQRPSSILQNRQPPLAIDKARNCPPGTFGRQPHCRPAATSQPMQPPPSATRMPACAPGTVGRWPSCRPVRQ